MLSFTEGRGNKVKIIKRRKNKEDIVRDIVILRITEVVKKARTTRIEWVRETESERVVDQIKIEESVRKLDRER